MCECDSVGSHDNTCDLVTGQCACKVGVVGRQCNMCDDSYFNFTINGCQGKKEATMPCMHTILCVCVYIIILCVLWTVLCIYLDCECSSAAINGSCDQDSGQCYCSDGAMGLTCDDCLPYNEIVGDGGCQPCDQCVLNLTQANSYLESQLNGTLSDTMMAVDLQNADTLSIDEVNATIEMQMTLYDSIVANITDISEDIGSVANSSAMVKILLENQQQEVTDEER